MIYFKRREAFTNSTNIVLQAAANPWDLSGLDPMAGGATGARPKNAVESLLGEHSNLVNLDNLTQVTRLLFGSRNLAHLLSTFR